MIPRKSPASNQRHQRQLSHKVRWAWDDGRGKDGGGRASERVGDGSRGGSRENGAGKKEARRRSEKKKLIDQSSYQWMAYLGHEKEWIRVYAGWDQPPRACLSPVVTIGIVVKGFKVP